MKHVSTWDLLDLADDMNSLVKEFAMRKWSERYMSAVDKLASIDTELLSRMPEFTYITVLDDNGNPVGFEPYIGEDNEYLTYLAIERQAHSSAEWYEMHDNSYF